LAIWAPHSTAQAPQRAVSTCLAHPRWLRGRGGCPVIRSFERHGRRCWPLSPNPQPVYRHRSHSRVDVHTGGCSETERHLHAVPDSEPDVNSRSDGSADCIAVFNAWSHESSLDADHRIIPGPVSVLDADPEQQREPSLDSGARAPATADHQLNVGRRRRLAH
jgi:hypothetical protein